jgi:hypothetical protein
MVKPMPRNALETEHIYLTVSKKWYGEMARIANEKGLSMQDLIRDWIGEKINLLPSCSEATN